MTKTVTRRLFLKLLVPAAAGAVFLGTAFAWSHRKGIYSRYFIRRPERANGALNEEELRHVMALAEVIYPPSDDEQKALLQDVVARWVTGRTAEDGYWPVYRNGVDTLRRAARDLEYERPYYDLSLAERDRVVRRLSDRTPGYPVTNLRQAMRVLLRPDDWRFRHALMEDLARGIYSAALGWAVVGYVTWPGVASPPLEYTRPPQPVNEAL